MGRWQNILLTMKIPVHNNSIEFKSHHLGKNVNEKISGFYLESLKIMNTQTVF